ncbi:serine hydrolase domain-containing protein [Vibrio vulnificus]|uniref:serine hydrolase domain-containing protein n=1 Tax=Vibrio vulnificus TaxID=672 RepID=UPI0004F6BCFC|nr:serine hydrolase domain-containing protein [Vibrio vulnificus]AIL73353.1 beta-lactamase [Vibrio vulnificus]PWY33162.1 serine hydrolase [Vibrio vulnificus]RZR04961.1 serine hydrolase [Vibrio vulnificus]
MKKQSKITLAITAALFSGMLFAENSTNNMSQIIENALKEPGARVTLPVKAAATKEAFTPAFVKEAREHFNNFHFQMGGDHALYYGLHLEEFMPSAESVPNIDYKPLTRKIDEKIGSITQPTSLGDITLDEYVNHPLYRTQAMVMIHKGEVVYEAYPGMQPTDRHLTASTGKITTGLVLAQLVDEGKVDLNKPIVDYVPELKGTVWDDVKTASVANMTTGLDNEETVKALLQPDSPVTRFLAAVSGSPRSTTGEVESWIDVARDQQKIPSEKQGDIMRYASINTTVLTQLIENVENKTFAEVFEQRVWSKLNARRSIQFSLSPEGTALPVGFMSAMPEDYARFGMLFTPSWHKTASQQVVSQSTLDVIYNNVDTARYEHSAKKPSSISSFGEEASGNALQFDYIWEDGAIAKSGNLGQMIYIDPKRDFVSVYFSTMPFVDGYGEFKAGAYQRAAAKFIAGE